MATRHQGPHQAHKRGRSLPASDRLVNVSPGLINRPVDYVKLPQEVKVALIKWNTRDESTMVLSLFSSRAPTTQAEGLSEMNKTRNNYWSTVGLERTRTGDGPDFSRNSSGNSPTSQTIHLGLVFAVCVDPLGENWSWPGWTFELTSKAPA